LDPSINKSYVLDVRAGRGRTVAKGLLVVDAAGHSRRRKTI
jgi:hypothetical protein